jgi:hypothetical protein
MFKIFSITILLIIGKILYAQNTNGIAIGTNYVWHNEINKKKTHTPAFGWHAGYLFNWQLSPKLTIGTGAILNYYQITTTYWETYLIDGEKDTAPNIYASWPLTLAYNLNSSFSITSGYQFGYMLVSDIAEGNTRDHAALVGLNYKLGFCQLNLNYRHSLNVEKKTDYFGYEGDLQPYTLTRHKIMGFQFSIYFPLNKKRDEDDE